MVLPKFRSSVFLAPMSGITDPAFRLLCREMGAGLTVTELTSIHALAVKNVQELAPFSVREKPHSIQLFGSNLELLEKAAQKVAPYFDLIDYNLGCPAQQITQQMAGAALLQKPDFTKKIFHTLVHAVDKPITLKMRTGINHPDKFLQISQIAEEEGISMITLHARTLKQGYSGKADWSLIRKLKETVSIPVVGNGDVNSPESAQRMFHETHCDYVMIGRAASTNPYIFTQVNDYLKTGNYHQITSTEKINLFLKYLRYSKKYNLKFSNLRIQAMNFTAGLKGSKELRLSIGKTESKCKLKELLKDYMALNLH